MPTAPAASVSPYSRTRQNLTVAALAFAGMGSSFMQTILMPIQGALPNLLDAAPEDTAWVITVTLLVAAVSTPIVGKLGDMFGKRLVAIILMAIMITGSLVCAMSQGLVPLIIGRGLQGMGTGVIPLGISMLRDIVDSRRLGTSVALVSATLGVGGAMGLPVSALVVQNLEWHMLFVFASVLSTLALLFIVAVVPKSPVKTGGRVDIVGAIGLAITLTGLLLAISRGNSWGWTSTPTLICLAVGLVTLVLWTLYELRVTNPLVDLRVSVKPAVLMTNLASVAMGFALFSSSVAFPQLLQLPVASGGMGLDLLSASLFLMPAGLAMLAMSPIAGRVSRTVGPRPLLVAGALVIATAYSVCVFMPLGAFHIGFANGVIGIGIGLGYAAMPALIMNAVPRSETAAANGLNTLMRSLGTTVAAALVGSILDASAGSGSAGSFTIVFAMGLVAAAVCAGLGMLIPRDGAAQSAAPVHP